MVLTVLLMWCVCVRPQVSALDQELIEVDPDTKEMLKLLVSTCWVVLLLFFGLWWSIPSTSQQGVDTAQDTRPVQGGHPLEKGVNVFPVSSFEKKALLPYHLCYFRGLCSSDPVSKVIMAPPVARSLIVQEEETCGPFPVSAGCSVLVRPWCSHTVFFFLKSVKAKNINVCSCWSLVPGPHTCPFTVSRRTLAVCPTCRSPSPPSAWTSSSPEESRRL